jgi:hypothetical protein
VIRASGIYALVDITTASPSEAAACRRRGYHGKARRARRDALLAAAIDQREVARPHVAAVLVAGDDLADAVKSGSPSASSIGPRRYDFRHERSR